MSLNGLPGYDEAGFLAVHASGEQVTSVRQNPGKNPASAFSHSKSRIPWTENGYYLDARPSFTFDPLFHAGCYYVQEASSMFLEQALRQTTDLAKPLRVLDLCAAPGGKSTHLQSLISGDSLLVSNEVIRARVQVLQDNIIKWGCSNVVVTNNDPEHFSRLEHFFDVIVVDAPCSGSGLFRRDAAAIEEWSENNVQLCARRQQRILADVWPALKKGGILIYSTCSYSGEEDEQILDWLTAAPELQMANRRLALENEWMITETNTTGGNYGYRFWPNRVKGEGFFLACFQKLDGEEEAQIRVKQKPAMLTNNEKKILDKWIRTGEEAFINQNGIIYAWPGNRVMEYSWLRSQLRMVYSGVQLGEAIRDKLVPGHALAMSRMLHSGVPATGLDHAMAIRYLQRKEIQLPDAKNGWQLVCFEDFPLGWVNVLPNRVNNYYPKELRILKEHE